MSELFTKWCMSFEFYLSFWLYFCFISLLKYMSLLIRKTILFLKIIAFKNFSIFFSVSSFMISKKKKKKQLRKSCQWPFNLYIQATSSDQHLPLAQHQGEKCDPFIQSTNTDWIFNKLTCLLRAYKLPAALAKQAELSLEL